MVCKSSFCNPSLRYITAVRKLQNPFLHYFKDNSITIVLLLCSSILTTFSILAHNTLQLLKVSDYFILSDEFFKKTPNLQKSL